MTHRQILNKGKALLKDAGIFEADNDAWLLFSSSFNMNKTEYLMHSEDEADTECEHVYFEKIGRRLNREPLQYIEGKTYFMGLEFDVDKNVLIPRFDTEILVENALKYIEKGSRVLDMCTGSGCIAISLSVLGDNIVTGADISEAALNVAEHNKRKNNADRVTFVKSDMFAEISGKYDYIVSNPPYIATCDILKLETEVKDKEPVLALDGHEDGLFFYRILAKMSGNYLKDGGGIFLEIGYDQAESVASLLKENLFTDIKVIKDLNGLDRVVCGWRK